jgi:hypothetical protein
MLGEFSTKYTGLQAEHTDIPTATDSCWCTLSTLTQLDAQKELFHYSNEALSTRGCHTSTHIWEDREQAHLLTAAAPASEGIRSVSKCMSVI